MKRSKVNTAKPPAFRIELGSAFILFFALLFFFDEGYFLAALIPAVLVHELGHILFLLFFGARPTRVKTALSGFEINYLGNLSEMQDMLSALAGPALGLLFSFLCARLGRLWSSEYLLMCSGIGFILNIFNFLPVPPLDGGRVLDFFLRTLLHEDRAETLLRAVGLVTAILIICSGFYFTFRGLGPALFLAGSWLFILQRKKACK